MDKSKLLTPAQLSSYSATPTGNISAPQTQSPSTGLLSPQQLASYATKSNPTNPTSTVGSSWDAFDKVVSSVPEKSPAQVASEKVQVANKIDLSNDVTGLGNTLQNHANNIADVFRQGMQGKMLSAKEGLVGGAKIAAEATSAIGDIFGTGIKALTDLISNDPTIQKISSSKGIGGVLDYINNAISQAKTEASAPNPDRQKIVDWANAHPNVKSLVKSAATVASNVAGIESGEPAAKLLGEAGTGAVNVAGKVANEGVNIASDVGNITKNAVKPVTEKVGEATSAIKDKATQMAINQEKSAWQKPIETSSPGYKKATAIYDAATSKGHDISNTLVNNGVKLSENVETGATGKKIYNTMDTADNLHADAAKVSNEMLRPALEKADASGLIPKTPVQDVIDASVKKIQSSKMTVEAKDKMIANLEETKISLQKQFPQGLSLTDLHDEKIIRDLNAKYSPIGDVATNMEATKNKAIADATRKMVEEKAPKDIPVKEFNDELAKQHQAANYLQALHGKTVPQSILSKISRWFGKGVGATVGGVVGGGIMGELAGYHIGGIIESMIEKIPASMRSSILDNLKTTNPEAFDKVSNYLNNRSTKGSVAQPMSNTIKNSNIQPKPTTFVPKSQTGKLIKTAAEQYKSIPNKQGGFVSIGGKVFKEIPEATKKEMIQAIDYLRIKKTVPGIEDTVSRLAQKYNISQDLSSVEIANKFEKLIENTKTK